MKKNNKNNKITRSEGFISSAPSSYGETNENISNSTNFKVQPSRDKIINQAFKFHLQGNIEEASKYYQYCINNGFTDYMVFSNYGLLLKALGK